MIIDLLTHVWSSPEMLGREAAQRLRDRAVAGEGSGPLDASAHAHEQAMTCVDMAFVFGFRSERLGANVPNEYIADFVRRDPQRRVGVAGIDPMAPACSDQLEAAIAMGFVGVAISPASQGFHPMHSDAMAIYERCEGVAMPIFITMGEPLVSAAMLEFARPTLLDEVARTFPKLRLVINRLGSPWIDETLLLLAKHPHVYADIAGVASRPWQLYNSLLSALSLGVMDKLLFASGFPHETPAGVIESLYSINSIGQGTHLPTVPRSQIRNIIERDSLTRLGLDLEVGLNPDRHATPVLRKKNIAASSVPASTNGAA